MYATSTTEVLMSLTEQGQLRAVVVVVVVYFIVIDLAHDLICL